ncbi:MAG: glutamate synthase large subunit [Cytophagales bacterium]|nr:glutamate synthase large subunit [Cytophagales bacterium]MDW8383497.1 glutamate synthase large subunit [Flammeovirgaceae bacterium]
MRELLTSFRDNCGFGLIANVNNTPSRQMTLDAIQALSRMIHRGAIAADGKSGDGAGFLFSMPKKFIKKIALQANVELPQQYAVAMMFMTHQEQKQLFVEACEKNDLKVLFFRDVPTDKNALGKLAIESMPMIVQAVVAPASLMAGKRFMPLVYLTRKDAENAIRNTEKGKDFYVCSFSDTVISYKGLVMPQYVKEFYLDLQDEDFETGFALFHQRFSTNTLPKWALAQPFRTLAHNGEINSIQANRLNFQINCESLTSQVFTPEEIERLFPILDKGTSDSGSVDNVFEFLMMNGVDFFKAIRSLIPAPWQNIPQLDSKLRAFYEFTSCSFEAWDGPAAISFTNGRYLACVLDRNGLRPAKYVITKDNRVLISSEYGCLEFQDEEILEQGKLQSGQMIAIDTKYGKILKNEDINEYLSNSQPYSKWLNENLTYLIEQADENFIEFDDYYYDNLVEMQRYHNYTNEVVEQIIQPMIESGKEETGSMGDDTPMAAFSKVQRNFTDFFRQKFAQVTNPPIDPLRERMVMSTSVMIGQRSDILCEKPSNAKMIKAMSPILSKEELDVILAYGTSSKAMFDKDFKSQVFYTGFTQNLRESLYELGAKVEKSVLENGVHIVILDDRCLDKNTLLIPMPMAIGFLNTYLMRKKIRSKVSIVAITGEVYDSHSACVMMAYGAIALYPYLLYATGVQITDRLSGGKAPAKKKKAALKKIQKALNAGMLKNMSKMGICTMESYQNAALFDIIGLHQQIIDECFPASIGLIPGLTYEDIEFRLRKYHKEAFKLQVIKKMYPLEVGSFYKYMDNGEYHDFSPDVAKQITKVARTLNPADYQVLKERINNRGLRFIRDFFELNPDRAPIHIDEVEPIESITKRFTSAAMSLGSISPEAHEAIAEAMNSIGAMSNSGEGGEDKARFGTIKNSRIKQVASGRFGVTPAYLRSADEIQIKIAQGAKPGEGGQLPGFKVTPLIASLRCTIPGVTLISPPPHHDIYSIEDLAQLIFDLKQVNPKALVSVKLVSSTGVGTIAVGVAKAYADKIIISGSEGGTGAAQLNSIKFAGNPWELGLAEAHNALKVNHLRDSVELQTDGGLKTGLDVIKAAILGAESFGFGTAILTAVGCKILRVCHLNKCSVGIATQDEQLRAHYKGTVQGIIYYLRSVAQEVREILAYLGYRSLNDIIGKTELLKVVNDEFAQKFDFSSVLMNEPGVQRKIKLRNEPFDKNEFEKGVLEEVLPTIKNPKYPIVVHREIKNVNRSFGALISGTIAEYYGDEGLPKETITINLKGYAGQSFGAFLSNGMYLHLEGTANDYVGKGMRGGQIVIVPQNLEKHLSLAGNTCLYGATGGKLFVAGSVGERFAVRNSGALAVVEGTGDHPCEYMTGGTVVVLGETGYNFGAGMTGGVAFVYDKKGNFTDKMNPELIKVERIDTDEGDEGRNYLKKILRSYHFRTQSKIAKHILDNFRDELRFFWLVTSKDMKAPLNPNEGN